MNMIKTGEIIAKARKEKGYTQKQVAELLNVTDKAISKWETGNGCPDIRCVSDLAEVLNIDEKTLLSGYAESKAVDNGNMKKVKFYVCPNCGNVLTSTGQADIGCCGNKLESLTVNEDEEHLIKTETMGGDYYVNVENHPMTKDHYILFICYVTGDKVRFTRLYPEQSPEAMFIKRGHGIMYICCKKHGLYRKIV